MWEGVFVNFESIMYFLRVCELGSLTKVAQELYTSQPTISRRILALEGELGVELLTRMSTGITVTDAGKLFYSEETKLMKMQAELMEKMKVFKNRQAGLLRIGTDLTYFLRPIFHAAQMTKKHYPNIDMVFHTISNTELYEQYACGKIDIAYTLRQHLPEDPTSSVVTLKQNFATLLIPKGHRLWGVKSVSFSDLAGEKNVIVKRKKDSAEPVYRILEQNGVLLKDALVCESRVDGLFQAAVNGYLALGGMWARDGISAVEDLFWEVEIAGINVDTADLCIAYHPSNSASERFVSFLMQGTDVTQ